MNIEDVSNNRIVRKVRLPDGELALALFHIADEPVLVKRYKPEEENRLTLDAMAGFFAEMSTPRDEFIAKLRALYEAHKCAKGASDMTDNDQHRPEATETPLQNR